MWRVDLVKNGQQRPLITEVPNQTEAEAIVELWGAPSEEWDKLVAVKEDRD